jgi:hypothetical protein
VEVSEWDASCALALWSQEKTRRLNRRDTPLSSRFPESPMSSSISAPGDHDDNELMTIAFLSKSESMNHLKLKCCNCWTIYIFVVLYNYETSIEALIMVQVILSSLTLFQVNLGCQDKKRGCQVKFSFVQSFCKDTLGNLVRALQP